MIKLVALDLDGTLINDEKDITTENLETIKKYHEQGIKFAICTGRTYSEIEYIPQFKKILPNIDYIIYENGAICIDKNKEIIFSYDMSYEDVELIYNTLNEYKMMFEVYANGQAHCEEKLITNLEYKEYITPDFYPLVEGTRVKVPNVLELAKIEKVQMILVSFLDTNTSKKAFEKVKDLDFYITFAGIKGLEFNNKQVDKGNGILSLAQKLGIQKSEIIAMGDSYNDLPMRKATENLVAMGNALNGLKDIADFVTKKNYESGVAFALEHYLSKQYNL